MLRPLHDRTAPVKNIDRRRATKRYCAYTCACAYTGPCSVGITQPEVAQIERRADIYISALRRYIEAAEGLLDITAHVPDSDAIVNLAPEPDADESTLSVASP